MQDKKVLLKGGLLMKKRFGIVFGAVLLVLALYPLAWGGGNLKFIFNGKKVDVPVKIVDGQVMVPASWAAKVLDAKINYDSEKQILSITQIFKKYKPVLFSRTGYSEDWKKTTTIPDPIFKDLYTQDFHVLSGNSQGAKTFQVIGLKKLDWVLPDPTSTFGVMTINHRIIDIRKNSHKIIVVVEPSKAGYDYVDIDRSMVDRAKLPFKQLANNHREYTFIFIDTSDKVLTQVKNIE